ncbi:uncharacterized protein LOC126594962 isoform X2 [Malus sylvestris]|uniref:uncharacterized protein LOC126594962 isoform X2 n=1 Tax=Malus sylvestris TaxID=3752 RepID=UPI0021AC1A3A|nr:uncharacterized protein LOC126594962 isoform X2 [Malus sylvestris]
MGSACSCFRSKDPIEDNNGDNASNGDVGFTQNLYNKIEKYRASISSWRRDNLVNSSNEVADASSIPDGAPQVAQSGTTTVEVQVVQAPLQEGLNEGLIYQNPNESLKKSSSGKEATGLMYIYDLLERGEECPTCLEEYTTENPKITVECSHHYHLSCIFEWMERSPTCPICSRLMRQNLHNIGTGCTQLSANIT